MIDNLKFWVQKILPTVYDDSLSYYELLNKVVYKLNEVITDQNSVKDYFSTNFISTVTEVIKNLIEDGTITSKINKIVCVEDYGAIGDGKTDSTVAIQKCITENPNSTIFFKGGEYLISSTLKAYGSSGGQTFIFGGSVLKWHGGSSMPMFSSYDSFSSTFETTPSICHIIGGTFNAYFDDNGNIYQADTCIVGESFYFECDHTRLYDFSNIGLLLGDYNHKDEQEYSKSQQAKIHDLYISMKENEPNVKHSMQDSSKPTTAIYISHADNQFSNIVTDKTGTCFHFKRGGHSISNTHTDLWFGTYLNPTQFDGGDGDGFGGTHIKLDPFNSGLNEINQFENCYFNNGKYVCNCVNSTGTNITTSITNSHYTFYATKKVFPNGGGIGYLWGGYPGRLTTDHFICRSGDGFTLRDYFPVIDSDSDLKGLSLATTPILNVTRYVSSGGDNIINTNNLQSVASTSTLIQSYNHPANVGAVYLIGSIITNYNSASDGGPTTKRAFCAPVNIQITAGANQYNYIVAQDDVLISDVYTKKWNINSMNTPGTPINNRHLFITNSPRAINVAYTDINNNQATKLYYAYDVFYRYTDENTRAFTSIKMWSDNINSKCYIASCVSSDNATILPSDTFEVTSFYGIGNSTSFLTDKAIHIGSAYADEDRLNLLSTSQSIGEASLYGFETVMGIGDGFTANGTTIDSSGKVKTYSYLKTLGHRFDFDILSEAAAGETTKTWIDRHTSVSSAYAYFLALGVNDMQNNIVPVGDINDIGTTNNTFYGNYSRIIIMCKAANPNANFFIFDPLRCLTADDKKFISPYIEAIKYLAKYYGIYYAPYSKTGAYDNLPLPDNYKPHPKWGYASLASYILKAISMAYIPK